jgi:hypothetical protein
VVLEATGAAFEIARIRKPTSLVVVANAAEVRAISHGRVKSDRFDARTLARLLRAGMLESVRIERNPRLTDARSVRPASSIQFSSGRRFEHESLRAAQWRPSARLLCAGRPRAVERRG